MDEQGHSAEYANLHLLPEQLIISSTDVNRTYPDASLKQAEVLFIQKLTIGLVHPALYIYNRRL